MASGLAEFLSILGLNDASSDDSAEDKHSADEISTVHQQPDQLKSNLQALLKVLPEDFEECSASVRKVSTSLSNGPLVGIITAGLTSSDQTVHTAAAELVAKIAKSEVCRCCPAVVALVPPLMALQGTSTALSTVMQATRALGNICYEHDAGRLAVLSCGGAAVVVALLQRALDWPVTDADGAAASTTGAAAGAGAGKAGDSDTNSGGLDTKVGDLDTKVGDLDTKVDDLVKKTEALDIKTEALDTKTDAMDTKTDALDTKTDALDTKTDTLDTTCVAADDEDDDDDEEDDLGNYGEVHELRVVVTGFLLNLTNSCDSITSVMCTQPCVVALSHYLERHCDEEDIPTHTLLALTCMADSAVGRTVLSAADLSPQLVLLLSHNFAPDVIEACLELATTLAELDSCKLQFASGGVCDAVMEVVRRCSSTYTDTSAGKAANTSAENAENAAKEATSEQSKEAAVDTDATAARLDTSCDDSDSHTDYCWLAIIQTATDLIVLILLGDASMPVIYNNGQGPVFLQLVSWLASDNEQLQVPAALAMGNFARTDQQSVQLVCMGVSSYLLQLLRRHCHTYGRIVVQHAVLAALRNLTIAHHNKRALIQQGAMDVLLPLAVTVDSFPVVFKLLATMRMIIDGNTDAAVMVGTCVPVMRKVLLWCGVEEHPGVKGEACRLLAWIIKNAIAGTPQHTTPQQPLAGGNPDTAAQQCSGDTSSSSTDSGNTSNESGNTSNEASDARVTSSNTSTDSGNNTSRDSSDSAAVIEAGNHGSTDATTAAASPGDDCSAVTANTASSPTDATSPCGGDVIGIPVGVAVLHSLVEAGCLPPMLEMLQSEYPVMIHEASLALSLCTSVCKNLPNMLESIDPCALGKGVNNTASRTTSPVASTVDNKTTADSSADSTTRNSDSTTPSTASQGSGSTDSASKDGEHSATQPKDGTEGGQDSTSDAAAAAAAAAALDAGLSHAMYNLLVACLAIADIEGGISILRSACVSDHFTALERSEYPAIRLAVDTLAGKLVRQ